MTKRAKHKPALIETAARLFRRQGYMATGTNEILAESGAPRGSLYYYFPGGKEEIGTAAVEAAGRRVTATLQKLSDEAASPAAFVQTYVDLLIGWLEASDFRDGCPISTTLLETIPASPAIGKVGKQVFADWTQVIATLMEKHGWPAPHKGPAATFILSSIEGALILARTEQSGTPLKDVADQLGLFLAAPPV